MKHSLFLLVFFAITSLLTSCSEENFDRVETETETTDVKKTKARNNIMTRASVSDETSAELFFECLSIAYPFELVDIDGNTTLISSAEDYENIVLDSFIIDFKYPLVLIGADNTETIVQDATEFAEVFAACIPDIIWSEDRFPAFFIDDANKCYEQVYPFPVEDEAGMEISVSSEEQLLSLFTEQMVYFSFPFDLVSADGQVRSIYSIDDFFAAVYDCNGITVDTTFNFWDDGYESLACYELTFPLDIVNSNNDQITINTGNELFKIMMGEDFVDFSYPLSLESSSEDIILANSNAELEDLLKGCYEYPLLLQLVGSGSDFRACYTIDYPISLTKTDASGNTITLFLGSDEEAFELEAIGLIDGYKLQYPISVSYPNGSQFIIEKFQDIFEASCQTDVGINGADPTQLLELDGVCFDIIYPINAVVFDSLYFIETGESQKINSYNSKEQILEETNPVFIIEFPFEVVLISDGKESEITDLKALDDLYESCKG